MSSRKNIFILTILVLLGLFFGGVYLYKNAESKKMSRAAMENESSLIREYSPTIGSQLLRVTLVEFLDPECEACRYFHPLVKKILQQYEGKIRYVVRYAPFHPNSKFAIKILEAARKQGKYWETLDLLFEKLPEWGSHHHPKPELIWTYLPLLNLDVDKIKTDMKDEAIVKMIEQEIKDGGKFGVRQTPTFFINGKPLEEFGPQQLMDAIESAVQ
jgi:protein-disulfide isomerase